MQLDKVQRAAQRQFARHRFLTPRAWSKLCQQAGLAVLHTASTPFKQPDLNWCFDAAAAPSENRRQVLELVANAPESARRLFRLDQEEGKVVWLWRRLTLIAALPGAGR